MKPACQVDGCIKVAHSRGWCMNHYMQHRLSGFRPCDVDGCQSPPRPSAGSLCAEHRPTVCSGDGCSRTIAAKGLCKMHWRQQRDPNRSCEVCGKAYVGDPRSRYCSSACKWRNMRHPLRVALEDGDRDTIIEVAKASSVVTDAGCWEWQFAKNNAGYPMLGQGGSVGLVHRLLMATVQGHSIGKQPVHHKCANPACINPDHLQLITHRENVAEMLTRKYLVGRISDLEAALREMNPLHPLLEGEPPP